MSGFVNGFSFLESAWLFALLLLPLMVSLWIVAHRKRRKILKRFVSTASVAAASRPVFQAVTIALAAAMLVLALARPAWNQKGKTFHATGRDIVFVLDASRSMLARDVSPSRLGASKIAISELLDSLGGERVALVVFAGSAEIRCPFTTDYDYFRQTLNEINTDSLAAGGTEITPALEKAASKLLTPKHAGFQDVILISDGGDHAGHLDLAAAALRKVGARLIAIGVGNQTNGSPILIKGKPLLYQKKEVFTRLQPQSLQQLVHEIPYSHYFETGTRFPDLKPIYQKAILTAPHRMTAAAGKFSHIEKAWLPLLFAWLFLLLAGPAETTAIHSLTVNGIKLKLAKLRRSRLAKKTGTFIAFSVLFFNGTARADSAQKLFESGNRAYITQDYVAAARTFEQAAKDAKQTPETFFNLGDAAYAMHDFPKAIAAFQRANSLAKTGALHKRAAYNLGNCYAKAANVIMSEQTTADAPMQALALLNKAVVSYRNALNKNSNMENATVNLEIVLKQIQQLQALQKARANKNSDKAKNSPGKEEKNKKTSDQSQKGAMELTGYSEMHGVPPPNVTAQQILNEALKNPAHLQKKKSGKYNAVEKNW